MEEIEVKILEIDKEKLVARLLELGAEKIFEWHMKTIYLDSEEGLGKGKTFRIRLKGEKCIITLKVRKEDREAKVNDEFETEVEDFEEVMKIFEGVGFREVSVDERKRVSYKLKNSLVEIDVYDDIPPFFEVESPGKEEMKEIIKLLGFSMEQAKTWSRKEVLKFYRGV